MLDSKGFSNHLYFAEKLFLKNSISKGKSFQIGFAFSITCITIKLNL